MSDYTDETYGELIADVYDDWYGDVDSQMLEMLTRLAGGGRALELGIGTGRVALPLSQSGVKMYGIDSSPAMLKKLRAKPGSAQIQLHQGNFANIPFKEKFDLIFVVFSTIYSLLTQEEQIRCFQNVADHLESKGLFAIEAFVPDLSRYQGGQSVRAVQLESQETRLAASMLDSINQIISSQFIVLDNSKINVKPVKIRYIWPSEMDLMARLAGLKLLNHWDDWDQSSFTGNNKKHMSIYGRHY
jgi:SAM-dependent methyltransferase